MTILLKATEECFHVLLVPFCDTVRFKTLAGPALPAHPPLLLLISSLSVRASEGLP